MTNQRGRPPKGKERRPECEPWARLIAAERAEREWSMQEMADAFGVVVGTISKWEGALVQPEAKYMAQIAKVLGKERAYLMRVAGYHDDGSAATPQPQTFREKVSAAIRLLEELRDGDDGAQTAHD